MYRTEKNSRKKTLKPGIYTSKVVSIGYDEEYDGEDAIRVKYELTDEKGSTHTFTEIFWNTGRNERTSEFFDYLEQLGISEDNLQEFKDCRERVTIKKKVSCNVARLSIVEREFLDAGDDGNDLATEQ